MSEPEQKMACHHKSGALPPPAATVASSPRAPREPRARRPAASSPCRGFEAGRGRMFTGHPRIALEDRDLNEAPLDGHEYMCTIYTPRPLHLDVQ